MRSLLLIAGLLACLLVSPVWAGPDVLSAGDEANPLFDPNDRVFDVTPEDDVPVDHWAYAALACLAERGVLEGYPPGFFGGQRTLTRFEFLQPIIRLDYLVDPATASGDTLCILRCLHGEFAAELRAYYLERWADEDICWFLERHLIQLVPGSDPALAEAAATCARRGRFGGDRPAFSAEDTAGGRQVIAPAAPQARPGLPSTEASLGKATASHGGLDYAFELLRQPSGGYRFVLSIANPGTSPAILRYDTNERYDFRLLDGGELRWNYNNNRFFVQSPQSEVIWPSSIDSHAHTGWTGTDNAALPLAPGSYRIEAVVWLSDGPVSFGFTVELGL